MTVQVMNKWGVIWRHLTIYKAEYAGKIVELVNPNGTSQTCICGHECTLTDRSFGTW